MRHDHMSDSAHTHMHRQVASTSSNAFIKARKPIGERSTHHHDTIPNRLQGQSPNHGPRSRCYSALNTAIKVGRTSARTWNLNEWTNDQATKQALHPPSPAWAAKGKVGSCKDDRYS